MIVTMNLIFSFDSILSALAITDVFFVLAAAIVVSGVMMLVLADSVSEFINRNRKYEVLGLFILFLVGVLLVTEGAHLAHMHIFTFEILAMSKSSFYLVVGVLIISDIISTSFQKRLWAQREQELRKGGKKVSSADH